MSHALASCYEVFFFRVTAHQGSKNKYSSLDPECKAYWCRASSHVRAVGGLLSYVIYNTLAEHSLYFYGLINKSML